MSEEIITEEFTLPGEWWWFVGIFKATCDHLLSDKSLVFTREDDVDETTDTQTYTYEDYDTDTTGSIVFLTTDLGKTPIRLTYPPAQAKYWKPIVAVLKTAAAGAQLGRRHALGQTPEGVIEYYYRSRARNSKTTLTELADLTGFSEAYLRKRKVEYDKNGGWGSKKAKG